MKHPTRKVEFKYTRRAPQKEMSRGMISKRWSLVVAHRRLGKTVEVIVHLILRALENKLDRPRYAYVAPFYSQAKSIAWDYLKHYSAMIPGTKFQESELWVELINGARIRLFGADNPDALRGQYWDGAVLDEVAQMRPQVWGEIIRPALSDRQGWAVFIGTPKGMNLFFELYQKALKDPEWYVGVFPADKTGVIPESELEAAKKGMSENQYRQEFLCDFTAAVEDAVIPFELVNRAAGKSLHPSTYHKSPLVFGVDPARFGDDRSVITVRRGLAVLEMRKWREMDTMTLAGRVAAMIDEQNPDGVFVDEGGLGAGVVDRLRQLGYSIFAVNSGHKASDDQRYYNLRAEIWFLMREWLAEGGAIPDDPDLKSDLTGPTFSYDARSRIKLEKKEDMKKRGLPSPDCGDSLAVTFAAPVVKAAGRFAAGKAAVTGMELPEWVEK